MVIQCHHAMLSMMDIPKQVKAWMPLLIGVIATAAGLILPLALATAYPETWGAAGWVLYFYIVPACALILLISAVFLRGVGIILPNDVFNRQTAINESIRKI